MSITGLSDTSKLYKKSFHRRNDSDELDVFEAARYFSGYNEGAAGYNGATYTQKILREDHHRHLWRGGRMSLDVPIIRNPLPQQTHHTVEKQILKEKKKYKQPSSPGGRLASFLNSLFNQTSSRKKKSKSASSQSMKDDDESPGGRRKRRISISHFRSSSSNADTKSFYSSSSSGFRTPPPYAHTPTKGYKEFRSNSDHKQAFSLSKQNGNMKSISLHNEAVLADKKNNIDYLSWLDEKFIKINDGLSDKPKNHGNHRYVEKETIWVDQNPSKDKEYGKFDEVDYGAESDSSSDLFELQNYDLGMYSSGLPVYETTNMDNIKRGAPISNINL